MWREILNPYELAVKELTCKFNHLIKEHHDKGYYSSIERVEGRVKTIVSILDKCQKKGISIEDVTTKIEDIAGMRIICQFVEDIERVVELLHQRSDIEIKQEKDYVSHRDNGKWLDPVVAVPGLSCPEACGILVPQPGMEPESPALKGRFLITRPPWKP